MSLDLNVGGTYFRVIYKNLLVMLAFLNMLVELSVSVLLETYENYPHSHHLHHNRTYNITVKPTGM